jgi:hypothetical protein
MPDDLITLDEVIRRLTGRIRRKTLLRRLAEAGIHGVRPQRGLILLTETDYAALVRHLRGPDQAPPPLALPGDVVRRAHRRQTAGLLRGVPRGEHKVVAVTGARRKK